MQFLTPHYEPWLVAQSVAIASFACFVAINLAGRAAIPGKALARAWWIGGSVALGSGIWAMHFVGMLAFSLPITLGYGHLLTGLSAAAAVAVSMLALALAVRPGLSLARLWLGALTMGGGIAVMHYTGMAALDMAPGIVWDPVLVAASLAVAVVASGAALHILRWLRALDLERNAGWRWAAALTMGLAICGMHYTGMAAASFPVGSVCLSAGVLAGSSLGWLLAVAAVGLLVVTLITSMVDAAARARMAQHAAALRLAQQANEDAQRELAHERELSASQAFLDKTGRIGGVGGWSYEAGVGTIVWTDQTCRIHGYEPGHRPTLTEAVAAFAPEARPVFEAAMRKSIDRAVGFDLELPFVTTDRRELWVRVVAEPEVDAGRTLRLMGALQDITARRAMESELRRKSDLLTSVLENIPCGLSAYDADLKLLAANTHFRRLNGQPDELVNCPGVTCDDMVRFNVERGEYSADEAAAVMQTVIAAARGVQKPFAYDRTRRDGTTLEIRGAPIPGGGFVLTHSDVTARRAAELALQKQTERLRLAADSAGIGIWDYDPASGTAAVDEWMYRIYGRPYTEGPQSMELWLTQLHPDDADGVVADIKTALNGGERYRREFRIFRPDGEMRYVQGAAHVEFDAQGRGLRMTGVNIDVTDERLSEQALREAKQAAESANVAKGQFLANISHEIRTPMNAVLGMLKLLRRTELTPRQADYAAKTDGAARALLRLINDILDFSKADAGKMTLEPRPFRLDGLLRELSVVLSANLGSKDVDLLFDIDAALPPWLVGDAMRLGQVLINLAGNAVKFTEAGEVVVSLAVVGEDAHGVTLEISVRDTGIGIAPENHARIFGGFTQAEASTTRRFGGTGLGLAISQRLVALMGGTLALDSAPGEGSRFHFRITLPLPTAEHAADDAFGGLPGDAPAPAPVPAAPLRALLVDDNPQARAVLERLVRSLGWTLDLADNGEAALALLQARAAAGTPCEAVFVDAQMPGMDGWRTCERIREVGAAGADVSAPIVLMLTAQAREAMAQRSPQEQALVDGVVVKPVTASMLVDALVDARSAKAQPHPSQPSAGRAASPIRRLEGMRLLVTEDNLNNQQVARELLEDEGATVQIADHGEVAVTVLRDAADSTFDVVLMDLQMPVMDGYTATRTIRQELGLRALPIVAMTANAMASDREACLAAGMNDHVAKPFDLDHLVRVLRRHARRPLPSADASGPVDALDGTSGPTPVSTTPPAHGATAAPAAAAGMAVPLPATVADAAAAAGVDLDAALGRLGGKRHIYCRMLGNFVADLATLPAQLQAAADDTPQCVRLLHTCKGLAASLGSKTLAAAAAQAEKQIAGNLDRPQADAVVAAACDAMHVAAPGLGALLQALQAAADAELAAQHAKGAAPAAPAVDASAYTRALKALATQLRESDMAATEAMQALRLQAGGGPNDALNAMDEAIAALDFDRALDLCTALIDAVAAAVALDSTPDTARPIESEPV